MRPPTDDFLDLCERVAALADQEAELRARRISAEHAAERARLDDDLEAVSVEKRFALWRAQNWSSGGEGPIAGR